MQTPFQFFLMRHGRAVAQSSAGDFDRDLAASGRQDVTQIAAAVVARGFQPERILSSPALRARETANAFVAGSGCAIPLEWVSEIYAADADELLVLLARHGGSTSRVMLIGHNPAIEGLLCKLTHDDLPGGDDVPPATLAVFEAECRDWPAFADAAPHLRLLLRPRELKAI